ncbi:hypothetical protein [Burkholderia cepacia]|uniref:hypothetical protein n=1 Tax=Burkholderia cepacia TaxID=292 RepID=UPI0018C73455|nr:hypothetical protein [Burkholderia cepacia]
MIVPTWFGFNTNPSTARVSYARCSNDRLVFPAFIFSVLPRPFGNIYGAFAGIATGAAIMAYFAVSNATLAQQLPNWPDTIRYLNTGLVALIINGLVFVVISLGTSVQRVRAMPRGEQP